MSYELWTAPFLFLVLSERMRHTGYRWWKSLLLGPVWQTALNSSVVKRCQSTVFLISVHPRHLTDWWIFRWQAGYYTELGKRMGGQHNTANAVISVWTCLRCSGHFDFDFIPHCGHFFWCEEHVFFVSIIELFIHDQNILPGAPLWSPVPLIPLCNVHCLPASSLPYAHLIKQKQSVEPVCWTPLESARSRKESRNFCPRWLSWSRDVVRVCQPLTLPDSTG